jgi:hypothetical protein
MKKIKIVTIIVITVFMVSCTSNTYQEISAPNTNPTYTKNIEPVIKANCTGCHSESGQYPALETYAEVKDATLNGVLICRIDQTQACGRVMPQNGAMSRSTIDMIILWQQQGCIN